MGKIYAPGLYAPEAVPLASGGDWLGCGDGILPLSRAPARSGSKKRYGDPSRRDPTARAVLKLAAPRFAAGDARDAAEAVPVYLRDKVALKTSER